MNNKFEIIGVYEIPNEQHVHLLEIIHRDEIDHIDFSQFTQKINSNPLNDQAAYDEKYLNSNGNEISSTTTNRVIFFFHYIDFKKPFSTPTGNLVLPEKTKIPKRLSQIVYYKL